MSSALARLQHWYARQCNDEWEHEFGVKIDTIDNPGWSLRIDLKGTALQQESFEQVKEAYEDEREWLACRRVDDVFEAACGPERLEDAIEVFLAWASRRSD